MSIVKFPTSNAKLFTLLSKSHAIFYDAIKGQATSNNSCQLHAVSDYKERSYKERRSNFGKI